MLNQAAHKTILNLNAETIIRVYPDSLPHVDLLEFVIMISGNDLSEDSRFAVVKYETNVDMNSWVSYSEDSRFGGDGSLEIKTDDMGREYAEWRNGDFWNPILVDDREVVDQLHIYGN